MSAKKTISIRNKNAYPVRIPIDVNSKGVFAYRRILGKDIIGPIKVPVGVIEILVTTPDLEVLQL